MNNEKTFARENNIKLVEGNETKLDKKIKSANEVFDYHNKIYLTLFKSMKQEEYLWQGFAKQDLSAIEQNKSALIAYSKEGLENLKALTSFNDDQSIYIACRELLQFYTDEAENKVPQLTDYFLKSEKFEKIKSAFDNKKASQRTQQDIDQYNQAVKEINEASETYNRVGESLNQKRKKLINTWNDKSRAFLNKHTPR